jgi:hypothetical protein
MPKVVPIPLVCPDCQGVHLLPGACYCREDKTLARNLVQLQRLKSWARKFRDHMHALARQEARRLSDTIEDKTSRIHELTQALQDARAEVSAYKKKAELIIPTRMLVKDAIKNIKDKDDVILSEADEAALSQYCAILCTPERLTALPTEESRLGALSRSAEWLARMRGTKRYSELMAQAYRTTSAEGALISANNMLQVASHPTHKSAVAAAKLLAQGAGLLMETKEVKHSGTVKYSIENMIRRMADKPAVTVHAEAEPDAPQ